MRHDMTIALERNGVFSTVRLASGGNPLFYVSDGALVVQTYQHDGGKALHIWPLSSVLEARMVSQNDD